MHNCPDTFRAVLGHVPTGVVVVTGVDGHSRPVGMTVGSFTSVSLDPPLVAFMPNRESRTWRRIREGGRFAVNVLAAGQEELSRWFASSAEDKFAGLDWREAGSGAPLLSDVVAWIDCDIDAVHEAGDHYVVVGRVRSLQLAGASTPLVFYRGGYQSIAV